MPILRWIYSPWRKNDTSFTYGHWGEKTLSLSINLIRLEYFSQIWSAYEYFIYFTVIFVSFLQDSILFSIRIQSGRHALRNRQRSSKRSEVSMHASVLLRVTHFPLPPRWMTFSPEDFHPDIPVRLKSSQVSSGFSTERSCKLSSHGNPVFVPLETASLFRDGASHLASLKGAANRLDGGFGGAFQKDSTAETVVPCGLKR